MTEDPIHYVLTGFPNPGLNILYNLFKNTVKNCLFFEKEMPAMTVLSTKQTCMTYRAKDMLQAEKIAEATNAKFIVLLRDPRTIFCSDLVKYWRALEKVPDPVVVYYEDLVSSPIDTQLFLETQMLDLDFYKNFSDLPIQDNSVAQATECPELNNILIDLGYEI